MADDPHDHRLVLADLLRKAMEDKHEQGREKYGDSWTDAHPDYHLRRMEEEFMEFRQAVEHYRDEDQAIEELADVVNYALMYVVLSARQGVEE